MTISAARHSALIRMEAPTSDLLELVAQISAIRGLHGVAVQHIEKWDNDAKMVLPTGWRKLNVRGTQRAVTGAQNLLMMSGLQELDANADHDHANCVARAQAMNVPAEWAHRPETYLSM